MNRLLEIFLVWLASNEATVSFWQTSPGSFARIQIGQQQLLQRAPSYLPQQQIVFVTPPSRQLTAESRGVSGTQFSNHIAPFVHFSAVASTPPLDPRKVHLMSTFLQTPFIAEKQGGRSRKGKRVEDNDADESKNDNVPLEKKKSERNDKQLIVDNLKEVSGLGSILKQRLRNKLKNLRSRQKHDKSSVKVFLEKSRDQEFLQDKTDGREGNFLNRLIQIVEEEEEEFEEEFDDNEKDYLIIQEEIESNEIDEGMAFFKQAGLIPDDDIKQQQKTFAFPYGNILDEEEEAVEVETKDLAQEISSLLSQLEETGDHEDTMMRKAKKIIKTKLEKFPLNFLLQDEDFIDSVFFRFAIMDLPLRPEDLEVYRGYQVNRVLRTSIRQASRQAESLLEDVTTRRGKSAEKRRSININKTRKELQKLLRIVS